MTGPPHPWEGIIPCKGTARGGRLCGNLEIVGLEFCLHHMPDELLAEAESICGFRRCRRCLQYAVEGTVPPLCKNCGANTGSQASKGAAMRVIEGGAADRAAEIIAIHGGKLAMAAPVEDPYAELMQLAGEMKAWKDLLQERVSMLRIEQYRYQGKTGEQTRAEIVLYERAIERLGSMLVAIAKLNLDARLVGIRQQTLDMLERALTMAFTKAGVTPDKAAAARETFREHIKLAS
jgi:hypothetical protein